MKCTHWFGKHKWYAKQRHITKIKLYITCILSMFKELWDWEHDITLLGGEYILNVEGMKTQTFTIYS